ncbi:MAG: hypothetical protein IJ088_15640 [Clostridia bacterium]|nr:hypothetical protein [Clostridia bacterium]
MSDPHREPDPRIVYRDIIHLPHHTSKVHPPMSLADRAAQFSAYKALTGYEDMVTEEARTTDDRIELGEAQKELLNRKLLRLSDCLAKGETPSVAITFFIPDERKDGGRYHSVTGSIRRIDPVTRKIRLASASSDIPAGGIISFDDLIDLQGDCLDSLDLIP